MQFSGIGVTFLPRLRAVTFLAYSLPVVFPAHAYLGCLSPLAISQCYRCTAAYSVRLAGGLALTQMIPHPRQIDWEPI